MFCYDQGRVKVQIYVNKNIFVKSLLKENVIFIAVLLFVKVNFITCVLLTWKSVVKSTHRCITSTNVVSRFLPLLLEYKKIYNLSRNFNKSF